LEGHLLGDLLLVIGLAAVGVALFERLGLPSIAGFLVMGALVGPGALGIVDDPDSVRALAELGVVFLLFEIGLELPFERIREIGLTALVAGGLQVSLTLGGAAGIAWLLGASVPSALAIGGLVAMSSTALVMGLLSDQGVIDAPQGRLSVAILLFQDLCIVPLLLSVPILAPSAEGSSGTVVVAVGRALLAMAGLFVVARFIVPWLLERAALLGSRDLFSLLALLIVVGSAVIAENLGLTLAVGAFIGGIVASASPFAYQMFAELVPLRGVLIGLFFTAVGMLFDPAAAVASAPAVLGWVAAVMLGKALIVGGIVGVVMRRGVRLAVLTGLGLAQTGEFSFVLAAAAGAAGLLSEEVQDVFIAGSVVTLVATPFLFRAAPALANWLSRWSDRGGAPEDEGAEDELRDHVVLLGFGLAGQNVARVLRAISVPFAAVEANAHVAEEARERGEHVVWGDATRAELLRRLAVERARMIVVVLSDPIATREAVAMVRSLAPGVRLLVKTRWLRELDRLSRLGADVVVAEELEGTLDLVGEVLRICGVAEGSVARFARELREEGYQALRAPAALAIDPWLAELLRESPSEWLELPDGFAEATLAQLEVRARTGATILAIERAGVPTPGPQPDFALREGDRVLAFGDSAALQRLRELLGVPA
jgi:CPA2 family monovalent cation:H+ antiporter-2